MSGDCKNFCRSKPGRRTRAYILPALLTLGAGLSLSARAATTYPIDIPAQPAHSAVVALALKTNISVGGADPSACLATSKPVRGTYTPQAALEALLAGGRCDVRRLDAVTFRLDLKPVKVETRKPAPPPAAPPVIQPPQPADVVVVSRRPTLITNIPRSVSLVPASVMRGNDLDLGSVAAGVPGMAVTNLGPGRDKILLRGVSDSVITGRTQSMVGLYLDDTPLTYNAPDPDLLLVDMARIEVLKGPQGALYGQGSLSGVVRLVTNPPEASRYESEISAGAGLTEGGQASWRVTGMVNIPLIKDKLALRGVLYDDSTGGFIRSGMPAGPGMMGVPAMPSPTDKQASNSTDRYGGRMAVKWNLDGNFTLTGTAMVQHLKSQNSQYVYSNAFNYHRSAQLAEPHDNDIEDLALTFEGETGLGTLKVALNSIRHTLRSGYDAQPLGPIVSVPNSGVLFYDEDQNIRLSTQEISLVSPAGRRLRWMAGWFSAQGDEHFTPHLVDVFTGKTLYNEDRQDKTGEAAVFGQLVWDFTPRLSVGLGVRAALVDHKSYSRINHVRLTNYEREGDVSGKIRNHRLTHSLVVKYQAAPDLMFYAQAADGFRTGGFNTTTLTASVLPTSYAGDHLESYETGLRWKTADGRLRLNMAAFAIRWTDIQSDQLRSTGLPVTRNLGDGVNTGVEVEADWRFADKATLHFAGQLADPRLDRPDPLFTRDKGSGMPFIARSSFSLSADWEQTLCGHMLSNTAVLSYRSKSPLNYGPLRDVRMDAFTNVDLTSALTVGRLRYAVRIENAAAAKGNSFAYGNPFTLNGANQITPLRPRTVWLSVSRRF